MSERVYKEYDQLKNRYEVETGAMHQAMQRASEVSQAWSGAAYGTAYGTASWGPRLHAAPPFEND